MVKKNASLAGRGVEILFGAEPKGDEQTTAAENASVGADVSAAEPREADVVPAEESSSSSEPAMPEEVVDLTSVEPIEPEWMAMIEAEAATTDLVAGAQGGLLSPELEEGSAVWPSSTFVDDVVDLTLAEDRPMAPEPEEAMASLAKAEAGAGAPGAGTPGAGTPGAGLDALATTPIGVSSGGAPAQKPQSSTAAATPAAGTYVPPVGESVSQPPPELPRPRDKSSESQVAKRIESLRISGALYDSGVTVGSGSELLPETPGIVDLTPEVIHDYERDQVSRVRSEEEVVEYVGFKQRQKLWDEVDDLYDDVAEILSTHDEQKDALRLLREAQDILMEKPRQYDVARFKVSQVKTLLTRRTNITRWTDGVAWGIFAYDVVWISVLLYLVFFFNIEPVLRMTLGLGDTVAAKDLLTLDNLLRLWTTLLWGGIGGVVNGFYGLFRHASQKKDFDRQYLMWYIAQPVIGFMLGGLTHLIMGAGFLSTTGVDVAGDQVEVVLFPSLIAWIAGFRQEFVLRLVDGIIRLLTPSSSTDGTASESVGTGGNLE